MARKQSHCKLQYLKKITHFNVIFKAYLVRKIFYDNFIDIQFASTATLSAPSQQHTHGNTSTILATLCQKNIHLFHSFSVKVQTLATLTKLSICVKLFENV